MVLMSHWNCSKATNICTTLDNGVVVFGTDAEGETGSREALFAVDWSTPDKGCLKTIGIKHGGDAWGQHVTMNEKSDGNVNEAVGVNFQQLEEYVRVKYPGKKLGGIAALCLDWARTGWDKLPDASLAVLDATRSGSASYGMRMVNCMAFVEPGAWSVQIGYYFDVSKKSQETITPVCQPAKTATASYVWDAHQMISNVIEAVVDSRSKNGSPLMWMYGSIAVLGLSQEYHYSVVAPPLGSSPFFMPKPDQPLPVLKECDATSMQNAIRQAFEFCNNFKTNDLVLIAAIVPCIKQLAQTFSGLVCPPKRIIVINLLSVDNRRDPAVRFNNPAFPEVVVVHGFKCIGESSRDLAKFACFG